MSGPLRSKQGCWTCRLRRKKCDERRDVCLICESLSITCYGYGQKPEWMDGGERERAMANSIKQIVKHTSRKKGRLGTTLSRFRKSPGNEGMPGGVILAPKSNTIVTENGAGGYSLEPTGSETSPAASTDPGTKSSLSDRNQSSSPSANQEDIPPPTEAIVVSRNETVLLMHFLDHVFPLQHPMYKPEVAEGGRSWLLSLLLRTKPLYHASLALSAYHRGSVLITSQRCAAHHSKVEQQKHLAICLKEFQEAIRKVDQMVMLRACPRDSLGLMASVVQLIYFELFAGNGNAWRIHLGAATRTFMQGYWAQSAELGILNPTTADSLPPLWEGQPNENVTSFKFLCGVSIWLDILDSITFGNSPYLLTLHSHALGPGSHIKLEAIIGSSNWAILQIGRIAALHENKVQLLQAGCLESQSERAEFDQKVDEIRYELQCGLTEQALFCLQVHSKPVALADTSLHNQALVTRLFALAASIYLYLVVQGSHEETGPLAQEAMIILRTQMPRDMMHVIIFPLYIIGYVASPDDQPFFKCVFSSAPVLEPSLEHRGKILPLLEEAWLARDDAVDGGGWQRSLNRLSESNILLL
ncbi:fungal-specific transcription factor domain-containing protein [Cadophora sp. MPI-SDFR-AT-0126]|nr:fungal-specific transcription factor domain-containing protein [Leotiomycetes sp. MPI-SDFR-AT-0126]